MKVQPELLIVEDDEYWIEHYCRILRNSPVAIFKAKTVAEAANLIGRHYFAAVIADLELPGMKDRALGGFEVIEASKRRSNYTELLVITAHTENDILDRVARASVGYITKPVNYRELAISASSMVNSWTHRFDRVITILESFSGILPILQKRGHNKPAVAVADEYDVQDLLHFLFKPLFPDVIVEEYTSKRAGKTKRLDLVFRSLETVIETKIVRTEDHGKKIADELDIDIRTYVSHPHCRRLVCFVYDPDHHINDPRTIERDLSGEQSQDAKVIDVQVMIRPL